MNMRPPPAITELLYFRFYIFQDCRKVNNLEYIRGLSVEPDLVKCSYSRRRLYTKRDYVREAGWGFSA